MFWSGALQRVGVKRGCEGGGEGSRVRLTTPGRATPGPCSWLWLPHCCTISFTDFPLRLCRPAPPPPKPGRRNFSGKNKWLSRALARGGGKGGSPYQEAGRTAVPPGFCDRRPPGVQGGGQGPERERGPGMPLGRWASRAQPVSDGSCLGW